MIRKHLLNIAAITSLGLASILWSAPTAFATSGHTEDGNSNEHNKITLCHATGSGSNPYVRITINANGVINGHSNHQDLRDIIPPFSYNDHGTIKWFAGLNWDSQGQAIFNNGCRPLHVHTPPVVHNPGDQHPNHPPVGGQGGGNHGGIVAGASTTAAVQAAQVQAPAGAVNAGSGGALGTSLGAVFGLAGSLGALGLGLRLKKNSL